ncbi:MAG: LamG domain-containing protein, partial [Flavisolibacter sp.]
NNSDAEFVFSIPSSAGHWSNANMLLIFDHKGAGSTADSSVVKLMVSENGGAVDHWFELTGNNRLANVTDGQWHHLAFAYDETTSDMKIYRDGVLYSTQSWAGHGAIKMDQSKASGFYLGGKTTDWGKSFNGSIDQFRLYNKALTAAEVQNLYVNKL